MQNARIQQRIRQPYQPGSFARNDLTKVNPADVKLPDSAPPVWPGYGINEDSPQQQKSIVRNITIAGLALAASASIFVGARMYMSNSSRNINNANTNAQDAYPKLHAIPKMNPILSMRLSPLEQYSPSRSQSTESPYLSGTSLEVIEEAKARVAAAKKAIEDEKRGIRPSNPAGLESSLSLSSLKESRATQADNINIYTASINR